jgi:hypothetical protein
MRRNLVPGLVLQALALSVVVLYSVWAPFNTWLKGIGELKTDFGYAFSGLSTAVFGGLLPFAFLSATGQLKKTRRGLVFAYYLLFWLWKGIEVDAFYRGQVWLFGDTASFVVIVRKTLFDQLIYCPFWAVPTQVVCFLWKDGDFSWVRLKAQLTDVPLGRRVVIVTLSSWVVWIPTVAVVYALPIGLQIPLFNLVICFWSLMLTSLSRDTTERVV